MRGGVPASFFSFHKKLISEIKISYSRVAAAFVGTIVGTKYPTSNATRAPINPVNAHVKNPLPLVGFMSIAEISFRQDLQEKQKSVTGKTVRFFAFAPSATFAVTVTVTVTVPVTVPVTIIIASIHEI
jgi:hypothetical protein